MVKVRLMAEEYKDLHAEKRSSYKPVHDKLAHYGITDPFNSLLDVTFVNDGKYVDIELLEKKNELWTSMDFGRAIKALKSGKKVKRKAWGGHWQLFKNPSCKQENADGYNSSFSFQNGLILATLKDNGGCAPAQPYQADILAEDWEVLD